MVAKNSSPPKVSKLGLVRSKKLSGISAAVVLLIILVVIIILSFSLGQYNVSPADVARILLSHLFPVDQTWVDTAETVVMQIRFPRIMAAVLIGGSLALAGASFQGLFRNPLVSPDILGVSSGAGFGAALAILLNANIWWIQVSAFCFGILAVGIAFAISRFVKGNPTLSLILAGMAISSLFGAFLSLAKYVADPTNQLPAITFWLMGGLSAVHIKEIPFVAIPMITGIIILFLIRWRLNVLAMGEEEAQALGVNTTLLRSIIIISCTLITASGVCIAGIIGWVGLIIPHIGRTLVGPDHKKLIPVTIILGAAYLLLMDDLARTLAAVEIPLGILTAIIGAPFFVFLLQRSGRGWA
jgi:iron complex transport system permease protein